MSAVQSVFDRLMSVGTLLVALGAVICFASGAISGFIGRDREPPAFLSGIGLDNAVKLAGLAVAIAGAALLFLT